jgi:hypothetical protein
MAEATDHDDIGLFKPIDDPVEAIQSTRKIAGQIPPQGFKTVACVEGILSELPIDIR